MLKSYSVISHTFTKDYVSDTLYLAVDAKLLWDGEVYIVTIVTKWSDENEASSTKTESFLNKEDAVNFYKIWASPTI